MGNQRGLDVEECYIPESVFNALLEKIFAFYTAGLLAKIAMTHWIYTVENEQVTKAESQRNTTSTHVKTQPKVIVVDESNGLDWGAKYEENHNQLS